MPTILVIEDDPILAETIAYNLKREGYAVIVSEDGAAGLRRFQQERPALILLDLMIPKISGTDVCRMVRMESEVPIIVLSARDGESDKVVGLEMGADDYVTKPFSMRELMARVRANLRRVKTSAEAQQDSILRAGPLVIDPDRHTVTVRETHVDLTPKEFALLRVLVERSGRLVTRDRLIDEVWGPGFGGLTTTLDVHIRRLREKVEEDSGAPIHIRTVRGLGYKFVDGPG